MTKTKTDKRQLVLPCVAERDYEHEVRLATSGVEMLRAARDIFKDIKCPKTLARVNAALSSALGAERHVGHRKYIDERRAKSRAR